MVRQVRLMVVLACLAAFWSLLRWAEEANGNAVQVGVLPEEKPSGRAADPRPPRTLLRMGTKTKTLFTFSSDGKTAASRQCRGGQLIPKDEVAVWDLATGRQIRSLPHRYYVGPVVFGPDSQTLVSHGGPGGKPANVIWSLRPDAKQWTFQPSPQPDIDICCFAFSPDGKTLAAGVVWDQSVRLWDIATGKQKMSLEHGAEERVVDTLAFSPDGKYLATGCSDKMIRLWEVSTAKKLAEFQGHSRSINALAFSPDGDYLASSGLDGIRLWKAAASEPMLRLHAHLDCQAGVLAWSPDARLLAAAANDSVRIWELASRTELPKLDHPSLVTSFTFPPEGRTLLSGSADGSVFLWDVLGRWRPDRPQGMPLTHHELADLWVDLAGDATKAHRAMSTMMAAPRQSVSFLKERVRPVAILEQRQIIHLIADLDSERFATRQKAKEELEKLGEAAGPALQQVLAQQPSLEVRHRVEQVLKQMESGPETLRGLRALAVCEYSDSPEARQVLATLAKGAPQARLTREAQVTIRRVAVQSRE